MRHLGLGNLLPGVARGAIELAFGQYGALEGAAVVPLRPLPGGGGSGGVEAHLTFREAAAAAAAQRSLNGAFIPSLTGAALVPGTTAAPSTAIILIAGARRWLC